jgi:hypothetical protein
VWTTEWRAINKKIGGIREAGIFFQRADTGETRNSAGEIIRNMHETVQRLVHFNEINGTLLLTEAYLRVGFSQVVTDRKSQCSRPARHGARRIGSKQHFQIEANRSVSRKESQAVLLPEDWLRNGCL